MIKKDIGNFKVGDYVFVSKEFLDEYDFFGVIFIIKKIYEDGTIELEKISSPSCLNFFIHVKYLIPFDQYDPSTGLRKVNVNGKKENKEKLGAFGYTYINDDERRNVKVFFENEEGFYDVKTKYIKDAILTLVKLWLHPLTVKPKKNKEFYFIRAKNFSLYLDNRINYKLESISPCFNSQKDAKQAILDIGEENILKAFEAVKGIFD